MSGSIGGSEDKHARTLQRRAARRAELLAAAMDVIRTAGAGVTMEEVATAGGISKPILYRHFRDREGLVTAITRLVLADLAEILEQKVGQARLAGSREGIRATIDAFFEYIERDPELFRFVVHENMRLVDPATVAFSEEMGRHVAAAIRFARDAAGRDSGAADVWGRAIVGMVQHTSIWWVSARASSRAATVDWLADLTWSGLSGWRPGTGEPPIGQPVALAPGAPPP